MASIIAGKLVNSPGHGNSKTESSELNAMIHPQYVLYSVAYLNRFHFPSSQVLTDWQRLDTKVITTGEAGANGEDKCK
ncbi:MAG: hypothetical protein HWD59_03580 [Coxiellaceae bacterium]|nr:MAG: hypothetical protein HWD59_03580 [Coxiellaceae bacterium]